MQNLPEVLEIKGKRVLTTKQLSEMYGADSKTIQYNFRYNKEKYILGKHYIEVFGEELRRLKTRSEFQSSLKYAKSLYLWTEKGALLHAKSLNTDKAWEVYDYLVDFYFRAKEEQKEEKTAPIVKPLMRAVVDIPENLQMLNAIKKIRNDLISMDVFLQECIKYCSEESYKQALHSAEAIVPIIISDFNKMNGVGYRIIQKQY